MITYPKTVAEYKKLRFDFFNNKLSTDDKITAESFITHWRVVTGAFALEVLVKVSGKKQTEIAKDLGIKSRQLAEMINGCNGLKFNKDKLVTYFKVNEDVLNNRQDRKVSKV